MCTTFSIILSCLPPDSQWFSTFATIYHVGNLFSLVSLAILSGEHYEWVIFCSHTQTLTHSSQTTMAIEQCRYPRVFLLENTIYRSHSHRIMWSEHCDNSCPTIRRIIKIMYVLLHMPMPSITSLRCPWMFWASVVCAVYIECTCVRMQLRKNIITSPHAHKNRLPLSCAIAQPVSWSE